MKKHLVLILTIIGISSGSLYGQTREDIYIIGTSVPGNTYGPPTGFYRSTGQADDFYNTPPITFSIYFKQSYNIDINHYNTTREPKFTLELPLSQLENFTVIDVAQFLTTKTKEQALEWAKTNYVNKKRIWIIDRNDFYKSSPSLSEPDRMKLIEGSISVTNFVTAPKETEE